MTLSITANHKIFVTGNAVLAFRTMGTEGGGNFKFCIAFGIPETRSISVGDILSFEFCIAFSIPETCSVAAGDVLSGDVREATEVWQVREMGNVREKFFSRNHLSEYCFQIMGRFSTLGLVDYSNDLFRGASIDVSL